jgi:hypothetical protein
MKKTVGRPKITTADFPKDWQEQVIKEMSEGASQEEIQGLLDISDKTLVRLMKDDKEFFRTIKRGRRLSKAWWLNKGRGNLENKEFSPVLWYMNMKNRFGWADKKEIDHTTMGKKLPTPIYSGKSKS